MFDFKKDSPESVGIPSRCLLKFLERLQKKQIPMHSFLLMRHDTLIAEGYYAPYQKDTLHRMFSISKSFTSIAIGLLEAEGKLSLDDPIVRYFPDKVPSNVHPWIAEMTIRDMLMMRTCHASTTYKVNMKNDWVESFFTVPPTHPSGKLFHYDTSSAHTLCALVERLSGMSMLDYLKQKLSVLELSSESYMLTDPFGISMGGSGLVAFPSDLLKFGYLLAHNGNINGKQLVPASYIKTAASYLSDTRMTAPLPSEACGYGYQIWRSEKNGFVCYGMGGQFIHYLPDYDLLFVTTADTQGLAGGNQLIYDALYDEILPYIQANPLPEDQKSHTELLSALSSLAISPLDNGSSTAPAVSHILGKRYVFEKNDGEFTDFKADFSNDEGCFTFTLHDQICSIHFGFGKLVCGQFPIYDQKYAASGIWVSENTLYVRAHIMDAFVGSVHFEVVFGESDVTVFMKKQEESLFGEFQGHLFGTIG